MTHPSPITPKPLSQAEMERAIRAGKKHGVTRVSLNQGAVIFDLTKPDDVQSNNHEEDDWNDYADEEDEEDEKESP